MSTQNIYNKKNLLCHQTMDKITFILKNNKSITLQIRVIITVLKTHISAVISNGHLQIYYITLIKKRRLFFGHFRVGKGDSSKFNFAPRKKVHFARS